MMNSRWRSCQTGDASLTADESPTTQASVRSKKRDQVSTLHRLERGALVVALVITTAIGCASSATAKRKAYSTIDNATAAVQAAVVTYKRSCGVGPGQDGPGTCHAATYAKAEQAYSTFQVVNDKAIALAERDGLTPLQVVSEAAATAVQIIVRLR